MLTRCASDLGGIIRGVHQIILVTRAAAGQRRSLTWKSFTEGVDTTERNPAVARVDMQLVAAVLIALGVTLGADITGVRQAAAKLEQQLPRHESGASGTARSWSASVKPAPATRLSPASGLPGPPPKGEMNPPARPTWFHPLDRARVMPRGILATMQTSRHTVFAGEPQQQDGHLPFDGDALRSS